MHPKSFQIDISCSFTDAAKSVLCALADSYSRDLFWRLGRHLIVVRLSPGRTADSNYVRTASNEALVTGVRAVLFLFSPAAFGG